MKIKSFIFGIFVCYFLYGNSNSPDEMQKIFQKNFVEIQYTTIRYSSVHPWIIEYGNEYSQYGVYINSEYILTQCDELPNSISISIKPINHNSTTNAKIFLADIEVNLCILKIEKQIINDSPTWNDLPIGEDPNLKQKIEVGFFDEFQNFEKRNFNISEYTITSDFGFTKLPVFTFYYNKNLKVWTPIFSNHKIVGFISYISDSKVINIPISRIQFFIEAFFNQNYNGFIVQGIQLEELDEENNPINKFYNTKQNSCLIKEVVPNTSFYPYLKKGDIILSIDSIKPVKKCMYMDPKLGIQKLELLLTRKINGNYRTNKEKINVKILRDKKEIEFSIPLVSSVKSYNSFERIPWKTFGRQSYVVLYGLVFVELSRMFLIEKLGKDWRRKAIELAYLYDTKKNYQFPEEKDRVIIVSSILPDPINVGYQDVVLKPVVLVNQKPVKTIKEFYSLIQIQKSSENPFLEIEFSDGKKVFFDLTREEDQKRILEKFKISEEYYFQ